MRFNRAGGTAGASTRQHTIAMFSCRVQLPKPGNVEIEVLVVQVTDQTLVHDLLEACDIEDIPGVGVDVALDGDVEVVVVPVKVGAVADAEHTLIFRFTPTRIREPMRGIEMDPTCYDAARHT